MTKLLIFTLSFLIIGNLCAQPAVQTLQNKLVGLQNMSADFQQIVAEKDGTVLQKTSGKMALERPNKFRWETTSEPKQLIITDGKKLWIYDPGLKQVTIRGLTAGISQTPLLLLINSPGDLAKNFIISKMNRPGDWFQLKPKDKTNMFTSIVVGFDNNNLKQINFVNQLGQKTNLLFSNIIVNQPNIANFNFVIPKDIDVINE
jgi:outer membrane lipoprotein carrier protein